MKQANVSIDVASELVSDAAAEGDRTAAGSPRAILPDGRRDDRTSTTVPQTGPPSRPRKAASGTPLEVLRFFTLMHPTWGIRELARESGLSRSRVHRAMQLLEESGILEQADGKYRLGMEILRLAQVIEEGFDIRRAAAGPMRQLSEQFNETVVLCVERDGLQCYLDRVDCHHPFRFQIQLGMTSHLHCSAAGKAILAWLPEERVEAIYLQQGLPAYSSQTITELPRLREDLKQVRARGYATNLCEKFPGVYGIGAPIFSPGGILMGSLSITLLEQRYSEELFASMIGPTMEAAGRASRSISSNLHSNQALPL